MSTPPERFVALWRGGVAQAVLQLLRALCTPQTRLIINSYSRVWEQPLRFVRRLGLARPNLEQNWLTSDDTSRFSFLWACDMADLEPDEPRRRLREAGIL